jgi:hypothetical protein
MRVFEMVRNSGTKAYTVKRVRVAVTEIEAEVRSMMMRVAIFSGESGAMVSCGRAVVEASYEGSFMILRRS